jgi:CheY-like chemotaxis protein
MNGIRDYALVLVVEDNPERVARFREWMGHPQLRLLHVRSGDGALGCLNDRFDCILLDHDLDEDHPMGSRGTVDGRGVVDRLVQSNVNRRTPIIIHSANPAGRNEMFQRLKANGFAVEIRPFTEWTPHFAAELREELLEEWRANRSPSC